MPRLIVAPEHAEVDGPVIFLAGPIQGATSWQDDAVTILRGMGDGFAIASPRRPWDVHKEFTTGMYNEQVDWETRWLRRAAAGGVILFWLARERRHDCGRAHAQTTRFELAEWKECARRGEVQMAIGIDEGFTGARYVRRRFAQDCPQVPLCATLEETCRAAVERLPGA